MKKEGDQAAEVPTAAEAYAFFAKCAGYLGPRSIDGGMLDEALSLTPEEFQPWWDELAEPGKSSLLQQARDALDTYVPGSTEHTQGDPIRDAAYGTTPLADDPELEKAYRNLMKSIGRNLDALRQG